MKAEYIALKNLQNSDGFKVLEALWLLQTAKVEESRDKAASRAQESAWRYWSGVEKGFKLATTALIRAIADMEKEDENLEGSSKIDQLLEEIKPK